MKTLSVLINSILFFSVFFLDSISIFINADILTTCILLILSLNSSIPFSEAIVALNDHLNYSNFIKFSLAVSFQCSKKNWIIKPFCGLLHFPLS